MSTSHDSGDFPDLLANDALAANLMKCAVLVKKGEKDPLIRQTIHDLTFYFTGKRVGGVGSTHIRTDAIPSGAQNSPSASSALSKKHNHHVSLNGVLSTLGLGHDDSSSVASTTHRTEAQKAATSSKNAERAKEELRALGFANTAAQYETKPAGRNTTNSKPPFQRPTNPASTLIANGWIEQQRRSKLRTVWKEVLASLVEGRKPGEESTLWIQREVMNSNTGKAELEALHQIPVKWLQQVSYYNYSPDHRFVLKVHNLNEEFVFRCERSEEAAQNWVSTLRSMVEIARQKRGEQPVKTALDNWDKFPKESSFDDEKKAPDHHHHHTTAQPAHNVAHATPQAAEAIAQRAAAQQATAQQHAAAQQQASAAAAQHYAASQQAAAAQRGALPSQQPAASSGLPHMSVSEMRAIAHGAGIQTHGMERGELELVIQQIAFAAARGTSPHTAPHPPPPQPPKAGSSSPSPPSSTQHMSSNPTAEEEARRQEIERKQLAEEALRRRKLEEDAARSRAAAEAQQKAEEEKRKAMAEQLSRQQQEVEKQQRAEEERKRLEAERLRREDEEHQRRVAEQQAAEQRRRQEEQQRRQQEQWQQQQQNWQKQQAEEELRRRAEEKRLAEEKRRQEEAYRAQHQHWQKQQPNGNPAGQPAQPWQQPQVPPNQQRPPFGQQQQQPPTFGPGQAPTHPGSVHPPPPPTGSSPVNEKYAKMAVQTGDVGQRSLQIIKHAILVEWALQPPAMQILRPIEILITTVHAVFPPKFGVAGHDHFTKWTVVTMPEILSGAQPDDEKLTKIVRRLRFFLHPDKLPRDLTEEQTYICKMLWDIISDAFEDHKKKEEELAWMR